MLRKNRQITAILIAIALILSSFTTSAYSIGIRNTTLRLNNGEYVTLTSQQLKDVVTITPAEAQNVAESFVTDMIDVGNVAWDEDTFVTSVIPMYDNTDENAITAYTVNFDTGYVVVSAFLDAQALIPEWSDKASPLYEDFDMGADDKLIYLGFYEYYVDEGNKQVKDISGNEIDKAKLTNHIEQTRSLDNIPNFALVNLGETTVSVNSEIANPITHGNANYAGPFVKESSVDYWGSNYMDYYTCSYGTNNGYYNHCGPVAITNAIAAYRNRYPTCGGTSTNKTNNQIFEIVAEYGLEKSYYNFSGGTYFDKMVSYALGSYHIFNMTPTVSDLNPIGSFNNLHTELSNNNLVIVSLVGDSTYGNHFVLCHGYTRLQSQTTGYYLTYMNIADGWSAAPRYMVLAHALNYRATVLDF